MLTQTLLAGGLMATRAMAHAVNISQASSASAAGGVGYPADPPGYPEEPPRYPEEPPSYPGYAPQPPSYAPEPPKYPEYTPKPPSYPEEPPEYPQQPPQYPNYPPPPPGYDDQPPPPPGYGDYPAEPPIWKQPSPPYDPGWGPPTQPECEAVWKPIAAALKEYFTDDDGQCNKLAIQAVRLPFHDCFVEGGCDGSIILTDECTAYPTNKALTYICGVLYKIYKDYRVGAADLINLASSIANKACAVGPYVPFYTGRTDNPTPGPDAQLPPPIFNATTLIKIFAAKGFTVEDVVALAGAHSLGGNATYVPFDTTPLALDSTTFYTEVMIGSAPTILASDKSLSLDPVSTEFWQLYARSQ